jgi:hypothetical protein
MANELTTTNQPVTLGLFQVIQSIAPTIHASRMFKGISGPEAAAVVMLKGAELGFPFTAAFEYIEMIEGKAALKPQGMLALIHRSGKFEMKVTDQPDGCTVMMRRRDTGFEYTASFTKKDAAQAGIIKAGGAYDKYAGDMYRARAIARCARVAAPDILAGMYMTAELRDEWTPGDVIDVQADEVSDD